MSIHTSPRTLVVTPEKCIGCRTCEITCAFSHPIKGMPGKTRIRAFPLRPPEAGIPIVCFQCDSAACVTVCPTQALQRNEQTGAIDLIAERCILCKACVYACPFGNMGFHDGGPTEPISVHKCDLCGGDPQCAKYCPSGALEFK
jgi:anaerobic carbon-monoxide dehydrogenase iron sulfur subunit